MDDLRLDVQHHGCVLVLHNLPLDTTREEVADFLYRETGLNVGDASYICLEKAGDLKIKAVVPVNRHAIANFFERLLSSAKFKEQSIAVRSAKQVSPENHPPSDGLARGEK